MVGRTYRLNRKSVTAVDAIEGARYSFLISGLLIITKMIIKFNMVPGMLKRAA